MKLRRREIAPDYTISPGEILAETLEAQKINRIEFAYASGIDLELLEGILNGTSGIAPETAAALEKSTGVSADLWRNLEASYRRSLEAGRRRGT